MSTQMEATALLILEQAQRIAELTAERDSLRDKLVHAIGALGASRECQIEALNRLGEWK